MSQILEDGLGDQVSVRDDFQELILEGLDELQCGLRFRSDDKLTEAKHSAGQNVEQFLVDYAHDLEVTNFLQQLLRATLTDTANIDADSRPPLRTLEICPAHKGEALVQLREGFRKAVLNDFEVNKWWIHIRSLFITNIRLEGRFNKNPSFAVAIDDCAVWRDNSYTNKRGIYL